MISKQQGVTTLLLTLLLTFSALLIMVYAAGNAKLQQSSTSNQYHQKEAFDAAEAGLEHGFAFLSANMSTVTQSRVSNAISYTIPTVTMGNSATFNVSYSSPAGNFTLITITSVGTSPDGVSTDTITQQVSLQSNAISLSAMARGTVQLAGGSILSNTITNANISAGGAVTINNGGYTVTSTGTTSSQGNYGSDLQQNVSSLSSQSDSAFFDTVFGASQSSVKSAAQSAGTYYNNAVSGGDYSQTLKDKTGQTIWIDQANVSLGQGVTIGSAANPVVLIVNGNLSIANGVRFYGFVYVASMSAANTLNLAGGARIDGGIGASGNINISNGFRLDFAQVPVSSGTSTTMGKIPGSWKDF